MATDHSTDDAPTSDDHKPKRGVTAVLGSYEASDAGTGATNFTNYSDNGFSDSK
ncbi:hypothetical protein P3T36_006911 [Kitasatospora sp. MAP12-15]|uniref:hypothetical protein n=1 Tax=unclassified Kitasatospora TaxID=2633591 RepID=UPI002477002A|nr:hypothetical protein [Kitasatospora sp. MAP12-44]MDH6111906.1 hypothetical protein [Kitasatospora sp. MAP12-44]